MMNQEHCIMHLERHEKKKPSLHHIYFISIRRSWPFNDEINLTNAAIFLDALAPASLNAPHSAHFLK